MVERHRQRHAYHQRAGDTDDRADVFALNGSQITVGGVGDGFSSLLPDSGDDRERYNLVPRIRLGDTSIEIDTSNPPFDDNIFLAVFHLAGEGQFPGQDSVAPAALLLFGAGPLGLGAVRRRG